MSEEERTRWNDRYRRSAGTAAAPPASPPHRFLVELEGRLPRQGRALDVAGGTGRHALWLARRGLEVLLLDIAEEGLALARTEAERQELRLDTACLDLDVAPLPPGPFQLIVCVHFLHRPVYGQLAALLAPEGLLVVVHPTRRNLERHGSPGPAYLPEEGELPGLLGSAALEVLAAEESWSSDDPGGRHEARVALRRLAAGPLPG